MIMTFLFEVSLQNEIQTVFPDVTRYKIKLAKSLSLKVDFITAGQ